LNIESITPCAFMCIRNSGDIHLDASSKALRHRVEELCEDFKPSNRYSKSSL